MIYRKLVFNLLIIFNSFSLFSQCEYTLENYSHNDCYGTDNGSIDIMINNPNSSPIWIGPNGFTSSSTSLSNLYAGVYYLTITNSVQVCTLIDSIYIEESIKISANFNLTGMCSSQDSVDVLTTLWGGTPPYTSIWNNGAAGPNTINLPPNGSFPNVLTVTDANFCIDTIHLWIKALNPMNPFMSLVGVICKDDNSGQARVFVDGGTPPYMFSWDNQIEAINDESSSEISNLFPGVYFVEVIDDMGCIIKDSIEIKSNPNICLTIYKAFSPNDDYTNEFWKIDNIHLYPEAVVSVYDRNGRQVFRKRSYTNSEEYAFGGKDVNDQPLPSATYYYVIDLENGDDVFKGTLTIVR
jgi:gliding motility-associated-like protein